MNWDLTSATRRSWRYYRVEIGVRWGWRRWRSSYDLSKIGNVLSRVRQFARAANRGWIVYSPLPVRCQRRFLSPRPTRFVFLTPFEYANGNIVGLLSDLPADSAWRRWAHADRCTFGHVLWVDDDVNPSLVFNPMNTVIGLICNPTNHRNDTTQVWLCPPKPKWVYMPLCSAFHILIQIPFTSPIGNRIT